MASETFLHGRRGNGNSAADIPSAMVFRNFLLDLVLARGISSKDFLIVDSISLAIFSFLVLESPLMITHRLQPHSSEYYGAHHYLLRQHTSDHNIYLSSLHEQHGSYLFHPNQINS